MAQALSGTAKEYKRIANELRSKHPSWDGAVGCIFLGEMQTPRTVHCPPHRAPSLDALLTPCTVCGTGGLFNVAPWPVGDKKKAKALLGALYSPTVH